MHIKQQSKSLSYMNGDKSGFNTVIYCITHAVLHALPLPLKEVFKQCPKVWWCCSYRCDQNLFRLPFFSLAFSIFPWTRLEPVEGVEPCCPWNRKCREAFECVPRAVEPRDLSLEDIWWKKTHQKMLKINSDMPSLSCLPLTWFGKQFSFLNSVRFANVIINHTME